MSIFHRVLASIGLVAFLFLPAALSAPTAFAQAGAAPTTTPVATQLDNPLGVTDINLFIGKIINAVLGLSGAVALAMFVWGGVQWLISGGSPEKIKQAKSTLVSAAIGIVILFTSYTLVNAIIQALASGTVQ